MVIEKTTHTIKSGAAKTVSATADLLAEERRARRELASRLKILESAPGVGTVNGLARKQVNGFVDFLREQSVVGLAVGLVLGTQLKQVVDSIVNNFISPLIGLLLPGQEALVDKAFVIHAFGKTSKAFGWGQIVTTLISFIAVAAVVYAVFKILRLDRLAKKPAAPATDDKGKKDAKAAGKESSKKAKP